MISFGRNLTSSADKLEKMPLKQFYDMLRNPSSEMVAKLRQLQIVKDLDKKQYGVLKRQLPYMVAASFNPSFRLTENFAFAEYFIVDIDHLSDKGISLTELRKRLKADSRVVLCFASPSGDGLKVVFRFSERCYDAGKYALFYKLFVASLARQYGLEQVVDTRTSDVTRACFLSIDAEAYYNPDAEPVVMDGYVDFENPREAFGKKKMMEMMEAEFPFAEAEEDVRPKDPDSDVMARIKAKLNPKQAAKEEKREPYVPDELNQIMNGLKSFVEDTGVLLYETINIQYGKKLRFKVGLKQAEINLFYGRRGFTVVQSPRVGTNEELNALMADLIESYLKTLE